MLPFSISVPHASQILPVHLRFCRAVSSSEVAEAPVASCLCLSPYPRILLSLEQYLSFSGAAVVFPHTVPGT